MTNRPSNGDERRDRGSVDRGVRRSRSPRGRRERNAAPEQRHRERSRQRIRDPSPVREIRQKNKGRELLDTSERPSHRNRSPARAHLQKPRRNRSQSSLYRQSTAGERKYRDPSPPRRRSPDRRIPSPRARDHSRRSLSPRRDRRVSRGRTPPPRYRGDSLKRERSPNRSPTRYPPRRPSPEKVLSKERRRDYSQERARKSPKPGRYDTTIRPRRQSPVGVSKPLRESSPPRGKGKSRHNRDEYRPGQERPAKPSRPAASGANSVEVNMNHRGGYGGHTPFNHQQMQAAFPLNPQYTQPQNYAQSPHHMTPGSSYHGSPQAQSPYQFQPQQPQFSPQQQYGPNYQPAPYAPSPGPPVGPPTAPQSHFSAQANSPQYHPRPSHSYQGQNYRGNHQGFPQNHFPHGRGNNFRGGRGVHHNNNVWMAGGPPSGPGRGHHNNSGSSTPQHNSLQSFSARNSEAPSHHASPQAPPVEDDPNDDPFRPSKDLQVQDTSSKPATGEKVMPPPERPPPTGPQAQSKFSFAFGSRSAKPPPAAKPEISQKLTAAPSAGPPRREPPSSNPDRDRAVHPSRAAQLNPGSDLFLKSPPSSRSRPEPKEREREPREPATRMVKKIMKREKPRPMLPQEFASSDSVYFRKPGNESVVGSGTYGKVFKGVHVYTKSMVALKKIRMEGERDGFPVTAVREIKLLQSLQHDNIVKLHEVMVERNDCFMVFEYLSHDLTGILNHPTFKLQDFHKKDLAKQMFEGLDYLHRKGVLHRDIKAANILVSNEGQLKIADFGLARFYAKRRQLDYTNRVITIWYRSPELLLGETQYGPAVDIWSAACVLVEIFTRHAIFPGDGTEMNQLDKIYAVLGTPSKADWPGLTDMAWFELLRPTVHRPNVLAEKYKERVTPHAYDLLEAMFQYDPAKRPSASEVLEHPYFTTEEPAPKTVTELRELEGDWHEFESKALRKENERKDKEAKKALQKETLAKEAIKKRSLEGETIESSDAKRQQTAALFHISSNGAAPAAHA